MLKIKSWNYVIGEMWTSLEWSLAHVMQEHTDPEELFHQAPVVSNDF